MDSNTFKLT